MIYSLGLYSINFKTASSLFIGRCIFEWNYSYSYALCMHIASNDWRDACNYIYNTIIKYIIYALEGWLVMPIKGIKVLVAKHSISQALYHYILTIGKWVKKGCIWVWNSQFCYVLYFSLGFVKEEAWQKISTEIPALKPRTSLRAKHSSMCLLIPICQPSWLDCIFMIVLSGYIHTYYYQFHCFMYLCFLLRDIFIQFLIHKFCMLQHAKVLTVYI